MYMIIQAEGSSFATLFSFVYMLKTAYTVNVLAGTQYKLLVHLHEWLIALN